MISKSRFYKEAMHRMMTGEYATTVCMFLKDMVLHHDIAVKMSKDCYRHTTNPRILDLTRSIIYQQEMEIAEMRQFQNSYNVSIEVENGKTCLDTQFETMSKGDEWATYSRVYYPLQRDKSFHLSMQRMDKFTTDKFTTDKADKSVSGEAIFLEDMIVHHQIGIEMALHIQPLTRDPFLLQFLRSLVWNQSKEIWQMRMILRDYSRSYWMSHSRELGEIERSKYSHYLPIQTTSKGIEHDKCMRN